MDPNELLKLLDLKAKPPPVDAPVIPTAAPDSPAASKSPTALEVDECTPAAGQGTLVVQCRADDTRALEILAAVDASTIRAESLRKLKRQLAELIAEHTGQTVERITEDSDRDRWFDPQEALEYGFIDHIVGSFGEIVPQRQRIGISA